MKIFHSLFLSLFLFTIPALVLESCGKNDQKPTTLTDTAMKQATPAPVPAATPAASLSDKAKKGQLLYYNTSLGKVHVACATCHSDGSAKTQANQIRQGHTLAGVTSRSATWNGMYKGENLKTVAYGGALCAAVFQKRSDINSIGKALSTDEVEAINEYLASLNSAPGAITSNLKIQWAGKPTFSDDAPDQKVAVPAAKAIMKLPGDPKSGESVFNQSCGTCHSISEKKIGPPMVKVAKDMNYVAQVVRFGSGEMAFYSKDIISDQQIADAIAYIQSKLGQ
ncbi:MAG: cytochrome c [Ignavibacteriota bacterium]